MRIVKAMLIGALMMTGCGLDVGSQNNAAKGGDGDDDPRLTGAIFTTTSDGTRVDANIYQNFCDVYLNGGPKKTGAAGLPAGDYYFQVTDPSGKTLLSTDPITSREVVVDSSGRFVAAIDHNTSPNTVDGGVAVQLCPFLPTPNPGCEFKVWLTPVEDYGETGEGGGAKNGFIPSRSKTDNFKVCQESGGGGGEDGQQTVP